MKIALTVFGYAGLDPDLVNYSLIPELTENSPDTLLYSGVGDDALISRSRSKAMSSFLESTDADVLVMVDHDVQWEPRAIKALARKADERKCIVGGFYAKRSIGTGFAGRLLKDAVGVKLGTDELYEAEYVSGGFTAIPRLVVEEVLKMGQEATRRIDHATSGFDLDMASVFQHQAVRRCIYTDGSLFWDFFRPISVPKTIIPPGAQPEVDVAAGKTAPLYEYLSEDWAFSWRAREANSNRPQYFWAAPMLLHWGKYGYNMAQATPRTRADFLAQTPGRQLRKP